MKESKNIKNKIDELSNEKADLNNKIKPVPKGYYEKKLIGISLLNEERYDRILKCNGENITKEKLKELRSTAIRENEPHLQRIKEIDELIPVFNQKLIEAKANELLEISEIKKSSNKKSNTKKKDLQKFIDTFIEKSKEIKMVLNKDIAINCNVSVTWITNHFNLYFLENIYDEMDSEYKTLNDGFKNLQYDESKQNLLDKSEKIIGIFGQNFSFIKRRIEKLKGEKVISEHLKQNKT